MQIHVQWDVNCFPWLSWSWTCCRQHPSLGWQGLGLVRDSPVQKHGTNPGCWQGSIPGWGDWTQRRGTKTSWWFQPLWKKNSQIGNLPQIGVKIKSSWNHQPENVLQIVCLLSELIRMNPNMSWGESRIFQLTRCLICYIRLSIYIYKYLYIHISGQSTIISKPDLI